MENTTKILSEDSTNHLAYSQGCCLCGDLLRKQTNDEVRLRFEEALWHSVDDAVMLCILY